MEQGEKRKRKLEKNEEEEESEEQQMEKFLALIKSTKNVRDRISKEKEEEKAKGTVCVWNPTFQPEDFIDDDNDELLKRINVLHNNSPAAAGTSGEHEKEKEDVEKISSEANNTQNEIKKSESDNLDLTLSL